MKKLSRSIILGVGLVVISGCGADEIASPGTGGNITINNPPAPPPPPPPPTAATAVAAASCPFITDTQGLTDRGVISGPTGTYRVCELPDRLNTSSTLTFAPAGASVVYLIQGQKDVGTDGGPAADNSDGRDDTNVVLTIQPGVILAGGDSSYLNINRGNQIQANGTAARPIIFTSQQNIRGENTDSSSGQWGGLIMNGRAPVTDCISNTATPGTVDCEREVEGTTAPPLYGGNVPDDSSGSVTFVQIRYSGTTLLDNSELQSLTTGGVGSGTVFRNIMSFNSADDGVEFFGGRINMNGLVVVGAEDDSIDTDTGVKANLQYVIAVQRSDVGDTIIEADSPNAIEEDTPRQNTVISNATFIQRKNDDQAVRIRGRADYTLLNTILVDASSNGTPCLRVDTIETLTRAANAAIDEAGPVGFESVVLDCATPFRDGSGTTAAQVQTQFDTGSNTNSSFTNTLASLFMNGANEDALVAFDPTGIFSSFFENAGFVGAAQSGDARFQGWTCDSATVTFGNNTGLCTSLPVIE